MYPDRFDAIAAAAHAAGAVPKSHNLGARRCSPRHAHFAAVPTRTTACDERGSRFSLTTVTEDCARTILSAWLISRTGGSCRCPLAG